MAFERYEKRNNKGPAIRAATDAALGVVLVLLLIVFIKPSAGEVLDVPVKLFIGITALLLFVRAASWRSEQ